MDHTNAAMARRALFILCEHFGYSPNYQETKILYMDLCNQVAAHRKEGGQHTVESLLLTIFANEVRDQMEILEERELPEGEG